MKLDRDQKNGIRRDIQLLGGHELHNDLLGDIPMEIVAMPSESFFSINISKQVHDHFFIKALISGFHLSILKESVLKVYYVASCTKLIHTLSGTKKCVRLPKEVNLIIQL